MEVTGKDSKQAWFVCLGGFLIQIFIMGFLHAFGVFFIEFIREFGISKATAAWLGSISYGVSMFLGPVTSGFLRRYGNRAVAIAGSLICFTSLIVSSFVYDVGLMFFTFSFVFGVGCSLAYTPTMTIASDYFDKYVTLATGIMVAGSSTGTLVLSPLAQALVSLLGWRNTFRIMSTLCLIGVWSGYMFKPLSRTMESDIPINNIKKSFARRIIADLQLWKNRVFVFWVLAIFCVQFGYYIPYVHLIAYAERKGLSAEKGSLLIMTMGGATAVGRVAFGKIVEYGYLNRLHMHQLSMVVTGTAVMLLPLIDSFTGLIVYVVSVGLVDGCYVVLLPTLTVALMGQEKKEVAWGYLTGATSITFTLGPPVAGWLYDITGSYNLAFHVAGIPIIMGAIIMFFIPWAQKTASTTNVMTAAARNYDMMEGNGDTSNDVGYGGTPVADDEEIFFVVDNSSQMTIRARSSGGSMVSISKKSNVTTSSCANQSISLKKDAETSTHDRPGFSESEERTTGGQSPVFEEVGGPVRLVNPSSNIISIPRPVSRQASYTSYCPESLQKSLQDYASKHSMASDTYQQVTNLFPPSTEINNENPNAAISHSEFNPQASKQDKETEKFFKYKLDSSSWGANGQCQGSKPLDQNILSDLDQKHPNTQIQDHYDQLLQMHHDRRITSTPVLPRETTNEHPTFQYNMAADESEMPLAQVNSLPLDNFTKESNNRQLHTNNPFLISKHKSETIEKPKEQSDFTGINSEAGKLNRPVTSAGSKAISKEMAEAMVETSVCEIADVSLREAGTMSDNNFEFFKPEIVSEYLPNNTSTLGEHSASFSVRNCDIEHAATSVEEKSINSRTSRGESAEFEIFRMSDISIAQENCSEAEQSVSAVVENLEEGSDNDSHAVTSVDKDISSTSANNPN